MARDIKKIKDAASKIYDLIGQLKIGKQKDNIKIAKIMDDISENVDLVYDYIIERKAADEIFEKINQHSRQLISSLGEKIEDVEIINRLKLLHSLDKLIDTHIDDDTLMSDLLLISGNFASTANELRHNKY